MSKSSSGAIHRCRRREEPNDPICTYRVRGMAAGRKVTYLRAVTPVGQVVGGTVVVPPRGRGRRCARLTHDRLVTLYWPARRSGWRLVFGGSRHVSSASGAVRRGPPGSVGVAVGCGDVCRRRERKLASGSGGGGSDGAGRRAAGGHSCRQPPVAGHGDAATARRHRAWCVGRSDLDAGDGAVPALPDGGRIRSALRPQPCHGCRRRGLAAGRRPPRRRRERRPSFRVGDGDCGAAVPGLLHHPGHCPSAERPDGLRQQVGAAIQRRGGSGHRGRHRPRQPGRGPTARGCPLAPPDPSAPDPAGGDRRPPALQRRCVGWPEQ